MANQTYDYRLSIDVFKSKEDQVPYEVPYMTLDGGPIETLEPIQDGDHIKFFIESVIKTMDFGQVCRRDIHPSYGPFKPKPTDIRTKMVVQRNGELEELVKAVEEIRKTNTAYRARHPK